MKSYIIDTGNPDQQLIMSNIIVSYEDFKSGNPYNTTFNVSVISGNYSGISEFEYNIEDFVRFVKEIKDLYDFKTKTVELNDICYGSGVKFCLDKTGHVTVSGRLYGIAMEHSITFTFITDQTALEAFSIQLYNDFVIKKVQEFN
ncbi:hypothetical protein BHU72_09215 [Desulfuribacillus stibiiarsenatis]|uniref:Uncharacterized protein n=1 Tax=Desulfuribacillus stibiiarsenatis TaxID=1390249 RepID=A0A1E5L3K8_9FIRM|nr:hypothetical protein [Desulfuribacillus stibiiarsenatis]OEH84661.1 hypothetical protein BHU72_09215 [Desulfuribacillus stibiiarsenatis]